MDIASLTYAFKTDLVGVLDIRVSDVGVRSIAFGPVDRLVKRPPKHPVLERLLDELDAYLCGRLKAFSIPLDLERGTEFQRKVWEALIKIPYGETRSYAEVAASAGIPKAARAVGQANRANDVPILIPCHRVICQDGGPGGYSSGLDIKRALLRLEGVTLRSGAKSKKG